METHRARKTDELTESSSNELEIVEFCLGKEYFGINVSKVREIIKLSMGLVPVPDAHPSIAGVINLRGKIIPVVNLANQLKNKADYDSKSSRVVVSDFNQMQVGFWVDRVTRIHRLSWTQVEAPSGLVQSKGGYAVGIIKLGDRILFLLDFEKIASDINPETGIQDIHVTHFSPSPTDFDRSTKKILIAEDSPFIRQLLIQYTQQAGYKVIPAGTGAEAWKVLEACVQSPNFKDISDHYHILITDIEMPQMDGLHLIKRIKEHPALHKLPCLVFSSMITKELAQSIEAIGGDGHISKPEIEHLVELVDRKVLR